MASVIGLWIIFIAIVFVVHAVPVDASKTLLERMRQAAHISLFVTLVFIGVALLFKAI